MKKNVFLLAFTAIALCSCKKESLRKMTVIRDCTGTYLRADGKDYHVCNDGLLSGYKGGVAVMANIRPVSECAEQNDRIVCMMLHQNEGWVQVTRVK